MKRYKWLMLTAVVGAASFAQAITVTNVAITDTGSGPITITAEIYGMGGEAATINWQDHITNEFSVYMSSPEQVSSEGAWGSTVTNYAPYFRGEYQLTVEASNTQEWHTAYVKYGWDKSCALRHRGSLAVSNHRLRCGRKLAGCG